MQIIDLSVPLNSQTPVYPGDPETKLDAISSVAADGHFDTYLSTVTHTGTHIDAPAHMIEDGKTLDQFPVSHFVARGVYIEVKDNTFDLGTVKQTDIRPGDIVLFNTNMSDQYGSDSYWQNRPAMSVEIAQYLADKNIRMIGLDTGSADAKGSDSHPVHTTLLAADVLIIENMTNLSKLKDKDFMVYALPLKLDVDGSPARVIAVID